MLNLILYSTKGCMTSEIMAERVEAAIIDLELEDVVRLYGRHVELNYIEAKSDNITDAPTLIVKGNPNHRLEGLVKPGRIRQFICEALHSTPVEDGMELSLDHANDKHKSR